MVNDFQIQSEICKIGICKLKHVAKKKPDILDSGSFRLRLMITFDGNGVGNIESATEALRAFRSFKDIRSGKGPMSCFSLKRLIKSFEETGSLEVKPRSGRPSTCKSVAVTVLQNAEAIETLSTYGEDRQALSEITFMQDGGPPHISRGAKQLLKERLVKFVDKSPLYIPVPSISPDLTPYNFGYGESATEALRAFRPFKDIRSGKGPMSCYSLKRLIKSFEETGSLKAKPRSGRPSTCKSVAVTVLQNAEAIETLSTYGELKVSDFEKRQEFAAWVFRQIDIDENWLSNVLRTDDAHFYLKGEFNIQNCLILATEKPRIFTEIPLHQHRVTVLCGFTSAFIIGAFFFKKINVRTFKTVFVTVGERYVQLLREKDILILQDRQALSEITFMQDGGPPHISRGAKQFLKDTFGENPKLEYSLDAQAIRRSRRLQRLEPEENIAMVNQETQTKMSEYHFQPFRNPFIFTGERNQNPEKWLKEFHRVARYNCWDDSMCLEGNFLNDKKTYRIL
ncbi:hypothetical protein LAZ67_14001971 [Cordylochernes scorpioides]|uniref:DUF4817 domain-containing protein n=1 Tax=Cordylochernes scorpioides TaxID=51811 RepID=A0ABY6L8H8_9ARAC|nr:hypothetical protein LAZ67_14001971 [Cordylochernes scorpioides]